MQVFIAIAVLLWSVTAAAGEQPSPTVAERFGWLSGCWGGERGTARFREIWTVASPDLMLGMSVTAKPSKPAEFEYLRIETRDGRPVYVAQPGGVPPTPFEWQAASSTPDTTIFANPQHDFPKRVGYRRSEPGTLLAWIDGGESSANRLEFPMKRVACPEPR